MKFILVSSIREAPTACAYFTCKPSPKVDIVPLSVAEAFDREHEEFLKTKQRLQSVMETTLNRESNVSVQQKHEIERLKLEMENLRLVMLFFTLSVPTTI